MILNLTEIEQFANHVLIDFVAFLDDAGGPNDFPLWVEGNIFPSVYISTSPINLDLQYTMTAEALWGFEYLWLKDVFEYDHPLEDMEIE